VTDGRAPPVLRGRLYASEAVEQSRKDHGLTSKPDPFPILPVAGLAVLLAAALGALYFLVFSPQKMAETEPGVPIGGAFSLLDHQGRRVSDSDFRGRYMLIYFGYSFCPDVCPLELTRMGRALDLAGAAGVDLDGLAPLFITIDPERDTVEQLAGYVPLFHPRLTGLTGTQDEIDAVTGAYRIYARKAAGAGEDPGDYLMDHSSMLLLMGPDGGFVTVFTPRESVDEIAARLKAELR